MHQGKNKVVIVLTSHSQLGETGKKTGYHLEELAVPYLTFKKSGAEIVLASPEGGKPPVDPKSAEKDSPEIQEFLQDPEAAKKLNNTILLSEVPEDIDVLFFPGGHGPMWDLAQSDDVKELVETVWRDGGIVAALCHGPAALTRALDEEGHPIVRGKRINSFTDSEERATGNWEVVPFHLEAKLRELGAKFEHSANQAAHVARDGRLVTGQNPASAKAVAQEVLRALEMQDERKASSERGQREAADLENGSRSATNIGRTAPPAALEDDALPSWLSSDRRTAKATMTDGNKKMSEGVARLSSGEPAPDQPEERALHGQTERSGKSVEWQEGKRWQESAPGPTQKPERDWNARAPSVSAEPTGKKFGGSPEIDANRSTSAEGDRKLRAEQSEASDRTRRQELDPDNTDEHEGRLLHDDKMTQDKKNKLDKSKGAAKSMKESDVPIQGDSELDTSHMMSKKPPKQNPPRRR